MGGILWIIVVGFVAGIIARLLSPGPNNPTGFILTTVLGIAGAFSCDVHRPGDRPLRTQPGRGLYHRDHRRPDCAVYLESTCCAWRRFRSGQQSLIDRQLIQNS